MVVDMVEKSSMTLYVVGVIVRMWQQETITGTSAMAEIHRVLSEQGVLTTLQEAR